MTGKSNVTLEFSVLKAAGISAGIKDATVWMTFDRRRVSRPKPCQVKISENKKDGLMFFMLSSVRWNFKKKSIINGYRISVPGLGVIDTAISPPMIHFSGDKLIISEPEQKL